MTSDFPEEMERVIRGVVHELNDTLGVILSVVRFLQRGKSREDLKKGLEIIEEMAKEGVEFAAKLRRVIPADPREGEFKKVDLIRILRKALDKIRPPDLLEVEIVLNTGSLQRLEVEGNGNELEIAFEEIAKNGLEAMRESGIFEVRVDRSPEGAVVEFIDTGEGMDEETIAHVFEPFFSRRDDNHLGLGLSMARGIVLKHGGRIELESKVGLGTRVTVILPV
jgi:signal transduction histidine kinase